jgi:hypothetical protein
LFKGSDKGCLVEHPWLDHEAFLALIKSMDVIMQVSFSETFCIVAADAVFCRVPVVGSKVVFWLSNLSQANPNSTEDMVEKLELALNWKTANSIAWLNRRGLRIASKRAERVWTGYFG